MSRANPVWLFIVSVGLVVVPSFGVGLAVVESRTNDPVVREPMIQEESERPYERSRNSDMSVRSHSERTSHSHPSSHSADDRAAHLTLRQMESLQRELSELRGLVETQEHEITRLKKSQQDLYLDLDKRLSQSQTQKPADKSKRTSIYAAPDKPEHKPEQAQAPKADAKREAIKSQASKATGNAPEMVKFFGNGNDQKQIGTVQTAPPKAKPHKPLAAVAAPTAAPQVSAAPETIESAPVDPEAAANIEQPTAAAAPVVPEGSKQQLTEKEKAAYETAYKLVRSKQYPEAIVSFQSYLTHYPKGEHAPNAHYWLGEVYMMQWQANKTDTALLENASKSFLSVTTQFSAHQKATDALLKLGIIENEKGNLEAARKYLSNVKDRYPGTAAARIAEARLQQMN